MGAIVLTGFMGTGKSEVGRRLTRRLGRAFGVDGAVEEIHERVARFERERQWKSST